MTDAEPWVTDPSPGNPTPAEVMALLSTPEGRRLIAAAGDAVSAYPDIVAATTALRRNEPGTHPALLAAAMTQVELRQRHADRLGPHANELLLTVDGAQQATRWSVAQHRVERLRRAGVTAVADLGCGLGLDLRAMEDAGLRAVGVERDPVTAIAAAVNAPTARIITGDCTDPEVLADALAGCDAVFVDPARRDPVGPRDARGGRVRPERDPARWSPAWPWVVALADRVPFLVAKVAPGMPRSLVPDGCEIEWVSVDGDLVEACVWFGPLATTASRRATIIDTKTATITAATTTLADNLSSLGNPRTNPVPHGRDLSAAGGDAGSNAGDLLLEPDPAVIRAGLIDELVDQLSGDLLERHPTATSHTITRIAATDWLLAPAGHDLAAPPLVTAYRIIDNVPTRERELRTRLERDGYADLALKARGLKLDATAFTTRARPRTTSGPRATVVLLPGPDGRARGYLVEPWASAASRAT